MGREDDHNLNFEKLKNKKKSDSISRKNNVFPSSSTNSIIIFTTVQQVKQSKSVSRNNSSIVVAVIKKGGITPILVQVNKTQPYPLLQSAVAFFQNSAPCWFHRQL